MARERRAGLPRGARALLASGASVLLWACAGARVEGAGPILARAWPAPPSSAAPAANGGAALAADPSAPRPAARLALTLEEALARIAEANPTLGAAQARVAAAEAARQEVGASYWPELSLGLDFLTTDNPAMAFGLLLDQQELVLGPAFDPTPGSVTNWRKELRLDWALYAPGRGESSRAAAAGEDAARLAGEAIERRLLNAGLQAWIAIGAARELAAVAAEGVAVVEERRLETEKRWREGAALEADVLRLTVRLAAARQEAAFATRAVHEAESRLNLLMGTPPETALELAPGELALGTDLPETLAECLARAEEERRDLAAAAHGVRRMQLEHAAAVALRWPWLRAFAAYDIDGPEPAIEDELDSATVGIGLRIPFSARTNPRIRRAEAEARRAEEELRAQALEVAREVRDGHETLRVALETQALAEAAVGAAEEAFRIVAASQDAGAATVTDVLEAEDARRQARVRVTAARAGVQLARARLVAAMGGVR